MTVGKYTAYMLHGDRRFGGKPRYYLTPPKDINMRVPDQIRKSVLFIGVRDDDGAWDWKATGYLISIPDVRLLWEYDQKEGDKVQHHTLSWPFVCLATARHVAKKLETQEFALRTTTVDGELVVIERPAGERWFYHPTEPEYVDAAVMIFCPPQLRNLDILPVPYEMFATPEIIQEIDLGTGDEVFIAGLFTEVREMTRQHPIIRVGNLAMVPGEKIPYGGKLIEAYLVESRSIGGLSGSPVFIRETIKHNVGIRFKPGQKPNTVLDSRPGESFDTVTLHGLGRIFFLGSMIGHWDTPTAFTPTMREAVNMGIAPVAPAHKILDILQQPELTDMAKRVSEEIRKKRREGVAVEDFAEKKEKPFTKDDWDDALHKVTRKIEPPKK